MHPPHPQDGSDHTSGRRCANTASALGALNGRGRGGGRRGVITPSPIDRPTRKMGDKERPSSLAPWQETKSYFRKLVLVSLQWVDPDFAIKLIITDVGTLTCVKIKAFFSFVRWMHMMNREQLTCVASKRKCGARRREKIIARGV